MEADTAQKLDIPRDSIHDQIAGPVKTLMDTYPKKEEIQLYWRKQKVKMLYPTYENDLKILRRYKRETDIIHPSNICNWDEMRYKELLLDKTECAICYSMIFYHHSVASRVGPIAYQCNLC